MSQFKGEEYDSCNSNDNLTDSSQSSLQTVLVTVSIEKPAAKNFKRVRFNSLVEVKFIPRRKKEKKRKKSEAEDREKIVFVEDTTVKTDKKNHEIQASEKDVDDFKGEVNFSEQWVPTTTETSSGIKVGDSCNEKATQKSEVNVEKVSNSDKEIETNATAKSALNQTTNVENETDRDQARVNGGAAKSRLTARKSYATNKITLGGDYIGNAMRLSPSTFPVTPPIQFCEFPARNTKRQNFQEFGSASAVWRLEKQAAMFCKEAEALIDQVTEKNAHIQSKLKDQADTVHIARNYRHIFPKEHIQASFTKPSSVQDLSSFGKPVSRDELGTKPVTRFPYIKHKRQQSIVGLSHKSSSELCLPQLLLYDGNGARSPVDVKNNTENTVNKEPSKFEQVNPEVSANGKIVIHYSYGSTKRLGL